MTRPAPAATVITRRPAVGHVQLADVRCPHGRHEHTVGIAGGGTAEMRCTHTGRPYRVTLEEPTP